MAIIKAVLLLCIITPTVAFAPSAAFAPHAAIGLREGAARARIASPAARLATPPTNLIRRIWSRCMPASLKLTVATSSEGVLRLRLLICRVSATRAVPRH